MEAGQHYCERLRAFAAENVEPGGIVFVGSSHLELFDTATLLPGRRIVNRGICGDRIGIGQRGILRRLDVSVFDCRPSVIVLENGANDLGELWRTRQPSIDRIAECYERVVETIRRRLPAVSLCLINVLPTSGAYAGMSPLVPPLNDRLEQIAKRYGCAYLDFYHDVVDDTGELRHDLTCDGLHLNPGGYRLWARRIAELLDGPWPGSVSPQAAPDAPR